MGDDGQAPVRAPADASNLNDFILDRHRSEVHLLLDNLSSNSDITIPVTPDAEFAGLQGDWMQRVSEITWPPAKPEAQHEVASQAAFLIRVRDYLNSLARPASGATIAFTLLVTQDESTKRKAQPVAPAGEAAPPASDGVPWRSSLAQQAYPDLVEKARRFRKMLRYLNRLLVAVLLVTVSLSWYLAYGNAALADYRAALREFDTAALQLSRAEQAAYAAETTAADTASEGAPRPSPQVSPGAPLSLPVAAAPAADDAQSKRPASLGADTPPAAPDAATGSNVIREPCRNWAGENSYPSFQLRDACRTFEDRDKVQDHMEASLRSWASLGLWGSKDDEAVPEAAAPAPGNAVQASSGQPDDPASGKLAEAQGEGQSGTGSGAKIGEGGAPHHAAWLANLIGAAILPVLYGLLGSMAAVIRSLSRKIKGSLLAPRDLQLTMQQLVLGAVIGACISLFIGRPETENGGAALLMPVALSPSAIAFVAGFGVEGVFQALEALIARIFNITNPVAPGPAEAHVRTR